MTAALAALNAGNLIAWGILGLLGLWALVELFRKAMSDARRAKARKTGNPADLTAEERRANVQEFVAGVYERRPPDAASDGSRAMFVLGSTLLISGIIWRLVFIEAASELANVAIFAGLVLAILGGAISATKSL